MRERKLYLQKSFHRKDDKRAFYEQFGQGLLYFHPKRIVQDDES